MMRTILGALAGYLLFLILGAAVLYGLLAWMGPKAVLVAGMMQVSATWLAIGLFLTGWIAGVAGRVAARVGDRPEAAILLAVVVAIQGFAMLPLTADNAGLAPGQLETMSALQALAYIELPDWYARTLPLFAAAFIGYGGYLRKP